MCKALESHATAQKMSTHVVVGVVGVVVVEALLGMLGLAAEMILDDVAAAKAFKALRVL